jgi:hypothetical protein
VIGVVVRNSDTVQVRTAREEDVIHVKAVFRERAVVEDDVPVGGDVLDVAAARTVGLNAQAHLIEDDVIAEQFLAVGPVLGVDAVPVAAIG